MTSSPLVNQRLSSLDKTLRKFEGEKKKVNQPEHTNTHHTTEPSFKVILGNKK